MERRHLPHFHLLAGLLLVTSLQAAASDPLPARPVRDPLLQYSVLLPIHASATASATTQMPTQTTRRPFRAKALDRTARIANHRRVRNDIDGDGRSELLWNRWTWPCCYPFGGGGVVAYWTMDGAAIVGTGSLWYHRDYTLVGSGDFDADGRTDLLWRRFESLSPTSSRTHYYIWRNRGDGGFDSHYLASLQENPLNIEITIADIDGDRKDDLVFYRRGKYPANFMRYWLLDGASIKRIGSAYSIPDAFSVTGVGDFDGDGRGDILWTQATSGDMHVWRARADGQFEDGVYIGSGNKAKRWGDWTVAHLHDVDNDGRSDIIWETFTYVIFGRSANPPARAAYWLMDGTTVRGTRVFEAPAVDSYIAAVGDLDGDGRADLFWRNRNEREIVDRTQLWRGRADGGFDEHFVARFDPAWFVVR